MFLFQILSRLVYVVPACMLRGTFLWVPITLKHTTIHYLLYYLFIIQSSNENGYIQIPFNNNHFENTK